MSLFDDKWARLKRRQSRKLRMSRMLEPNERVIIVTRQKCCGMRVHPEKEYFWGKAGLVRVATLIMCIISMCAGFPGYQGSGKLDQLYVGYGQSNFIFPSIILNFLSIIISYVVIIMLLIFADVRCKQKWDYRNMVACVTQCLLMITSGFCQVMAARETRIANCVFNSTADCRSDLTLPYPVPSPHLASSYRPPYYLFQYGAAYLKMGTAMMYCICGRICLKNEDTA